MAIPITKKLQLIIFFVVALFLVSSRSIFATSGEFKFKSPTNDIAQGNTAVVEIYIDTDTPVNAAQLNLSYPSGTFEISIDSNGSAFDIKAQETVSATSLVLAKGTIKPLTGNNLFAKLNVKALKSAKVSDLQAITGTQILTSSGNKNIYTSTIVEAEGATNPDMPQATVTETPKKEDTKNFIFRAIKEFFKKLFRL